MPDYHPSFPHSEIEEIADNVYMVRGSIKINPLLRITRNMAIIRNGSELSVINPLRLNEAGETQLNNLGNVANVIRLGAFHGIDDPYYIDRFSARMWSQSGGTAYIKPDIDMVFNEDTKLPFDDASVFSFTGSKQPECALLLNTGDGLLLTCDAIQHYGDYSFNNLPARLLMPFIGFPRTTIVGPIWLKLMTPESGSLAPVFRKLLELKFDRLLAGHGTLLQTGAHSAVVRAVDKAFN